MRAKIIAIANQKGGVGKTTTTVSLGVGLAKQGKRVLLVDSDPQGSLTISLGYKKPDELEYTLAEMLQDMMDEVCDHINTGILKTAEGVDLIPANIILSGMEIRMVSAIGREYLLREMLSEVIDAYDYILIDCMPSLGILTLNALTTADTVLIPTQPHFLSAKGLELLLGTIARAKKLNPSLSIKGILFTMVDARIAYQRDLIEATRTSYNTQIPVFQTVIPKSVRAEETPAAGQSIFAYDPKGKVAAAYQTMIQEVL